MPKRKRGATAMIRDCSVAAEAREDHKKQIYHISVLQPPHKDTSQLFCTVGANRVSIYELSGEGEVSLLTMFVDQDATEVYYCCAWGRPRPVDDATGPRGLYIAFAGLNGCLYVQHLQSSAGGVEAEQQMSLIAHGGPVNMIKVHQQDQNLIFSASKDESVRLWSACSGACVAVFAGGQGHTSEVLSIDVNMNGTRLASAGMDNSIRVWNVEDEKLQQTISAGHAAKEGCYFKPRVIQTPEFVTDLSCEWKPNYIDCVQWVGDLVLAKSVHNRILLFEITKSTPSSSKESALVLQEYSLTNCTIWYLRFAVDPSFKYLAIGNMAGTVCIWDIDKAGAPLNKFNYSQSKGQTTTIRHTTFAMHNKFVIAGTDDAKIIVWKSGIPQKENKLTAVENASESD